MLVQAILIGLIAYVPPDETIGGVLACAFAIQLGQSTEAAIALAMPIATLCLAIKNVVNAGMPLLVDRADVFASKGNLKGIYAMHWIIGLVIVVLAAMGFAMLGRLVLTKQLVPFYFLGFLLCSYANVPVLGVALIAIIIGIDKYDLLGLGGAQSQLSVEGDEDDDF